MRISARSRYGMRLMINLAANSENGYSFLKDIAKSEGISEKYLSLIVIPLKAAGLLKTSRGVHGGYILSRTPSKITAKEVVEVLEGDLSLVECTRNEKYCVKIKNCASHDIWSDLSEKMAEFLNSITLEDLAKIQNEKKSKSIDYSI
ncbi:MAG: Rrf2 family transcriptional regulator [Actinobacteria bacterium]|nr:Rrf2 family transcriptional regulator [Actinomycetota bacterium]